MRPAASAFMPRGHEKKILYVPNFEEVDGACWFWVVRACFPPFVKNCAC